MATPGLASCDTKQLFICIIDVSSISVKIRFSNLILSHVFMFINFYSCRIEEMGFKTYNQVRSGKWTQSIIIVILMFYRWLWFIDCDYVEVLMSDDQDDT